MDGAILQAFISLSILVLALCAIMFAIKKYAKKQNSKKDNMHNIQILSKTSILPKSHLFVVQADDRTLLLGAGENGVNLIADLSANDQSKSIGKSAFKSSADTYRLPTSVNKIASDRQKNAVARATRSNPTPVQRQLTPEEINKSLSFSSFLKSAFAKQ